MNKLLQSRLAGRLGTVSPPIFRKKSPETFEPEIFRAEENCVCVCFDINDLRSSDWDWDDPRFATHRMLCAMLTVHQRLQTELVILGFGDTIVPRKDGTNWLLHVKVVLKSIEEDFDDVVWQRISSIINSPPVFPGSPTCFHAACLADFKEVFVNAATTHSTHSLIWWARRSGHHDFPQYRTPEFVTRVADHVDHEMVELGRVLPQGLDAQASFLPQDLKQAGRAGGFLNDIDF